MTPARVDALIGAVALALSVTAAVRMRAPLGSGPSAGSALQSAAVPIAAVDAAGIGRAAQSTADADPFRISRLPSDVPYSRVTVGAPPPPPAPPRPALVLKGIVGGPPWQAIIDGLPGAPPGSVVAAGNTFGKLNIRSVTRDTVVVQSPDTTWLLTLSKGSP